MWLAVHFNSSLFTEDVFADSADGPRLTLPYFTVFEGGARLGDVILGFQAGGMHVGLGCGSDCSSPAAVTSREPEAPPWAELSCQRAQQAEAFSGSGSQSPMSMGLWVREPTPSQERLCPSARTGPNLQREPRPEGIRPHRNEPSAEPCTIFFREQLGGGRGPVQTHASSHPGAAALPRAVTRP